MKNFKKIISLFSAVSLILTLILALSITSSAVEAQPYYISIKAMSNHMYVTADPFLKANSAAEEKFQVFHIGGTKYAFKSVRTGKFLANDLTLYRQLIANRNAINTWETFDVGFLNYTPSGKSKIYLKSVANGKYVSADLNYAGAPLVADRDGVNTWETFEVDSLGFYLQNLGNITLKARQNGLFAAAEDAGNLPLMANRNAANTWETFQVYGLGRTSDGKLKVALKSLANSKFVVAENAGYGSLIANRNAISTWETFIVENFGLNDNGKSVIALKAMANNKFVSSGNGIRALKADMSYVDSQGMFIVPPKILD